MATVSRISAILAFIGPLLVEGSWTDPSHDVVANTKCHPETVKPAIEDPKSATELHPAHIKYVLALGDSVTAAALAEGGPVEYRQTSFSGGAGSSSSITMPYLLNQYSGKIVGAAKGLFQWDQLAPCCGKAPWYSGLEGNNDQLNAALSGGLSKDWQIEVQHVTDLVTGKGFGIEYLGGFPKWSTSQQDDYKKSWKVLTVFLGMNDVLTTLDACSEDQSIRSNIVSEYRKNMVALFEHLVGDPDQVFTKTYVNLATLFFTSYMGVENDKEGWCDVIGDKLLQSEFPCMRSGGDIQRKGELVDNVTRQLNDVLVEIADTYDQKRPDFAINLIQTAANQQIFHQDLRSPLDCFHPTAKAHRILGTALWNGMLAPSKPTPLDELVNMPQCADSHTKLVTYKKDGSHRTSRESVVVV